MTIIVENCKNIIISQLSQNSVTVLNLFYYYYNNNKVCYYNTGCTGARCMCVCNVFFPSGLAVDRNGSRALGTGVSRVFGE